MLTAYLLTLITQSIRDSAQITSGEGFWATRRYSAMQLFILVIVLPVIGFFGVILEIFIFLMIIGVLIS